MAKNKKIDRFFNKLYKACRYHSDAYSVAEICQYLGVSHAQAQQWANEDPKYDYVFELCHMSCYINAEEAWIMKRLPEKEARKYVEQYNQF